jgi:predicted CopG family antitoxin
MDDIQKHPGGRPSLFTSEELERLKQDFEQYIQDNTIPIVAEFAYQHNLTKQYLYDREEFSDLLKKCVQKKEANLEKGALAGKLTPSVAIFSLKQLGWTDKQELTHSGEVGVVINIPKDLMPKI